MCLQTSSSLFMKYHSSYFTVDEVSSITLKQIITKCNGIITNCDSLVYYKVWWTVITNCDSFFITKCDTVYYKLRQVLQSAMNLLQIATGITNLVRWLLQIATVNKLHLDRWWESGLVFKIAKTKINQNSLASRYDILSSVLTLLKNNLSHL